MRTCDHVVKSAAIAVAAFFMLAQTAAAQTGVKASWSFDMVNGTTIADESDNGNNATIVSGTFVPGVSGTALSLNGSSDYVSVNNSATLNSFNKLTIECWVNMRQIDPLSGAGQTIIRKENSYVIGIGRNGSIGFYIHNENGWEGNWTFSARTIRASTWNHIVGVWDGQTLMVYINGILDATTMWVNGPITVNNNNVYIGKFIESNYEGFNGIVDELKVYNYDLSADTIFAHFEAYSPNPVPKIIPYTPNPTYNQRPQLRWYSNKLITEFRLQVATTPDFYSPLVTIPLSDTFFMPAVNLPLGTVYWRVGNGADSSVWSRISSINILDPRVPMLIPMVPDTQVNRKPKLRWHPARGASSYQLQIDTAGDFASPFITYPLRDTFFTPFVNLPLGRIFWRVSADANPDLYSDPDTFLIIASSAVEGPAEYGIKGASAALWVNDPRHGISLTLNLDKSDDVSLKVFNAAGACVATLFKGVHSPGMQRLEWQGIDSRGRQLPNGGYWAVLRMGNGAPQVETKKIILMR